MNLSYVGTDNRHLRQLNQNFHFAPRPQQVYARAPLLNCLRRDRGYFPGADFARGMAGEQPERLLPQAGSSPQAQSGRQTAERNRLELTLPVDRIGCFTKRKSPARWPGHFRLDFDTPIVASPRARCKGVNGQRRPTRFPINRSPRH